MKRTDYTTLIDAALFLDVPVRRIEALIRNNQIFGIVVADGQGFVSVEDVIGLAET